jgi:phosphate transport system substrate-binding protein
MKKVLSIALALMLLMAVFTGCAKTTEQDTTTTDSTSTAETSPETGSGNDAAITVVSREDGSGTRSAFIELFGIEQEDADGNKVDATIDTSEITNSTSVMMTTIAGNKNAIGYISLGSLNDTVKALKVNGVEASVDNVKNGSYEISRPFNIVTGTELSDVAQDFINFIMSDDGQKVIEDNGYISQGSAGAYTASGLSGKITVAGSSSVTPVMEKLKEAYVALNPDVTIEVQQSDSTTGVNSAIEGICDIGMASRDLKDSETASGVSATVIAMDGIAVIVNNENAIEDISSDNVMKIYTGEINSWSDVK